MTDNLFKNKFLIPSIRLTGHDYREAGYYFVTICAKNRFCYFGDIVGEEMLLNDVGKMTIKYWLEIPKYSLNVTLDEFAVMPNNVHGIIIINGDNRDCRDEAMPRLYVKRHLSTHPFDKHFSLC